MKILQESYVKYGLIMTGILIFCLFVIEVTGQNETFDNKSPVFLIYQFIAPAAVWYFGILARKKANHNHLTFKQGFIEGFKISAVFAVTSPFVFLAYYAFINPGILDYVREMYNMVDAPTDVVLGVDFSAQFLAALLFGSIYGAMISFVLKSKHK